MLQIGGMSVLRCRFSSASVIGERRHLQLLLCLGVLLLLLFGVLGAWWCVGFFFCGFCFFERGWWWGGCGTRGLVWLAFSLIS